MWMGRFRTETTTTGLPERLQRDHKLESSQYGLVRLTKLDIIKKLRVDLFFGALNSLGRWRMPGVGEQIVGYGLRLRYKSR